MHQLDVFTISICPLWAYQLDFDIILLSSSGGIGCEMFELVQRTLVQRKLISRVIQLDQGHSEHRIYRIPSVL